MLKALGFEPETLSMSELQVALQQGVIDGQENPPTTLLTSGWYKNQKYLSMTKHQITYQWVARKQSVLQFNVTGRSENF